MNKKVLSLLLLMVMVLVTACGNNTSNNGSSANTGSNAAEGGETGAGDKLKVVLLIPGTLGDKSFLIPLITACKRLRMNLVQKQRLLKWALIKRNGSLHLTISLPRIGM